MAAPQLNQARVRDITLSFAPWYGQSLGLFQAPAVGLPRAPRPAPGRPGGPRRGWRRWP
uniref:Uncharacterized protein n=1 Tax=uncultured marine virus TaxID=186617 RepID=A0A0F7L7P9_9VIRU|nr:hypothetical protein [uncultured marine virus]